ncbi:MAG TPA: fructokinase, partial [Gammaproteobacteria bacterium]|nr:fructokinase [Gammaproteobacteria bacterium]
MRIGVDLGGTKIEGIVLTDQGEIVEKIRVATPG